MLSRNSTHGHINSYGQDGQQLNTSHWHVLLVLTSLDLASLRTASGNNDHQINSKGYVSFAREGTFVLTVDRQEYRDKRWFPRLVSSTLVASTR